MLQARSNFSMHTVLFAICVGLIMSITALPLRAAEPSGEAAKVAAIVEQQRAAIISGNEKVLSDSVDDHLTYGHSNGMILDKAQFVKMHGGAKFNSIKYSNQTIDIVGNNAVVRHVLDAEVVAPDGKVVHGHAGALEVWKKEKGGWKLLGRQAFPLN